MLTHGMLAALCHYDAERFHKLVRLHLTFHISHTLFFPPVPCLLISDFLFLFWPPTSCLPHVASCLSPLGF